MVVERLVLDEQFLTSIIIYSADYRGISSRLFNEGRRKRNSSCNKWVLSLSWFKEVELIGEKFKHIFYLLHPNFKYLFLTSWWNKKFHSWDVPVRDRVDQDSSVSVGSKQGSKVCRDTRYHGYTHCTLLPWSIHSPISSFTHHLGRTLSQGYTGTFLFHKLMLQRKILKLLKTYL